MAQFPMGGFFNRQRQSSHHNGQFQQFPQRSMPMQMPGLGSANQAHRFPQQNVPRGTFPPNFNASRGMPSYPPANMQHPPMPGQGNMPHQIPPGQNMPPMHLLNPTNDPNVRFEPMPGQGQMPSPSGIPTPPPLQAPQVSPSLSNAAELIIMVSNLTQGESNSITFYENMARSSAIAEKDKRLVEELLSSKRQQIENVSSLYRNLTNSEWAAAKDIKVEGARNFRADIAYALLQESRLLREASQIYANLNDMVHQRVMSSILHNKVADIAHLMSL